MLHYLTHPSCGLLTVCGILLIATIGAPLICKYTDFALRPDLGFIDDHRTVFEAPHVNTCLPHQCVCDFKRSEIIVLANNAISLRCAVAGCGRTMVLGQDLASQYPIETVETYR